MEIKKKHLSIFLLCFQDKDKVITSQLSLVDLAGSERMGRTNAQGDRLKEAGSTEKILLYCIITEQKLFC